MQTKNEKPDPLSLLPTWRLICLLLASLTVTGSSIYCIGSLLFKWPGLGISTTLFCVSLLPALLLLPHRWRAGP